MDIVIIEGGFFKRPKAVGKGTSPSPLGTTDLRNSDTVCKVCEALGDEGLKSGLSHNGTYTPRRLLCARHSQNLFGHLKRRGT
jgi:hypothetical protein